MSPHETAKNTSKTSNREIREHHRERLSLLLEDDLTLETKNLNGAKTKGLPLQ